ncbi:MAG: UvrD-helicase domain-containing protein [Spirochaetales bacterium]|nr:UvrD-helicase domain-containing protein [Spirochaetales bacterium]
MEEQFDIKKFDPKVNMYIKASAGTGKTFTVQNIVAELLRMEPVRKLEEILIVTYTEKAAGELRDRIRGKIQKVIESNDYNDSGDEKYLSVEEQKENFMEQLALVDNAPIYTIHSFCKQTLQEFGFSARQCDSLELVDEEQVSLFVDMWFRDKLQFSEPHRKYMILNKSNVIDKNIFIKACKKYYQDFDGNENPEIVVLDRTVDGSALEEINRFSEKDLSGIVSRHKLKDVNYLLNFTDKINDEKIVADVGDSRNPDENSNFKNDCKALISEIENKIDALNDEIGNIRASGSDRGVKTREKSIASLEKFKSKLEGMMQKDNVFLCPRTGFAGIAQLVNPALVQKFSDFYNNVIYLIKNFTDRIKDNLKYHVFEEQLPLIYAGWNEYKGENKLQSFDDMIRNVHESVCSPDSELKQKLKEKYSYGIIDEFQDTNQIQWNIFKSIFMEDKERSICVVGDPKQSIYAFQGADVNVYAAAINEIEAGNDATGPGKGFCLGRNYRSTNRMIEFCNALFRQNSDCDFFHGNSFTFENSNPPDADNIKPNAKFNGVETEPVWIVEKPAELEKWEAPDEYDFARFVVQQIIKCCTYKDGKTQLQIYKKNVKDKNSKFVLTDVNFSDFAVLCKSKSEMEALKEAFQKVGIPYNHYKEANLFMGKECRDWIALYAAISAGDFSASNRKFLNECLISDFFNVDFKNVSGKKYDKPDCKERGLLIKWQNIAKNRQWAYLQEQIYEDTQVEKRLSSLENLTSLSKLRQVGDYCVDFLYKNNCTVDELVNHLSLLAVEKGDADEEDGNLVAKGTDFNSVQIMTIHASKGLEFPVVIAPAGLKRKVDDSYVYSYHCNDHLHITCNGGYTVDDVPVKEIAKSESVLQWMRLFYVAYTRATSLMILPWMLNSAFDFINDCFKKSDANCQDYLKSIALSDGSTISDNALAVRKIIGRQNNEEIDGALDAEERDNQKKILKKMGHKVYAMNSYKLSYSNLSHGKKEELFESFHVSDQDNAEAPTVEIKDDLSRFDLNCKRIPVAYEDSDYTKIIKEYPKGSYLGETVHQVLENAEFNRVGNLDESSVLEDSKLAYLINTRFKGQGFKIDEDDSKGIRKQSARIVWNTLNARFPEIVGSNATGNSFSLKELADNQHKAELEFNMNPDIAQNADGMRDYFNGFIDLIFYREVNGRKVYSIADWKTDSMDEELYADEKSLGESTDTKYSIQRVLYSYCLIKWLRQFNAGKSESEIFEEQFGGIFYVYVRGCKAGTGNGIYAQTWNCWDDLETAFHKIVEEKIPGTI